MQLYTYGPWTDYLSKGYIQADKVVHKERLIRFGDHISVVSILFFFVECLQCCNNFNMSLKYQINAMKKKLFFLSFTEQINRKRAKYTIKKNVFQDLLIDSLYFYDNTIKITVNA